MARPVLANKLFTQFQGHSEPEYLPPYYLPDTLDVQQKKFLELNNLRMSEIIGSAQLPSPNNGPKNNEFANLTVHAPDMVSAHNVQDLIIWTEPHFP